MKISEIIQSSHETIISKTGKGPYLYYDNNGEIIIECSLEKLLGSFVKNGQVFCDIDIYAYGFKKDANDTLQYINTDDLKNDSYEYIEAEKDNGKTLQVPSYCEFDKLLYFNENAVDMTVNCKPIKVVISEEFKRCIEKNDMIRKQIFIFNFYDWFEFLVLKL